MNLDRVTITGADDSIDPLDLIGLSKAYPFVEWGILVSKSQEGSARFPSRRWLTDLVRDVRAHRLHLSVHVCGSWVRRLMIGNHDVFVELDEILGVFQRMQLNFHALRHEVQIDAALLDVRFGGKQIIVQMDGTGNEAVLTAFRERGIDCVPLFDRSGGAGEVPAEWPRALDAVPYQGYAGGLGPETLPVELPRMALAAELEAGVQPARVWIDMERRVRSDDDAVFELDKVRSVLEFCAGYVTRG